MRVGLLTVLVMVAFAANSVLNRLALIDPGMGPASFAAIRLVSGALALAAMVAIRDRAFLGFRGGWHGAAALAVYVLGFSFAYVSLDAGVGALILFGGVQLTMFGGALWLGETVSPRRWIGAVIALGGLAWLLWPGATVSVPPFGAALMLAAALGWGLYSLIGRGATDPLAATAGNFLLAAPVAALLWGIVQDGTTPRGLLLAVISGVLTSGLGYALWYSVLPRLQASVAAVAQLTVPVIALAGGALLIGEGISTRLVLASFLVLGGVLLSILPQRR